MQKQWGTKLRNWAIFYRTTNHQGIHTKNYTESWHWVLKTSYLPPTERLQLDEVVQVLSDNVESHYRWAQLQENEGFLIDSFTNPNFKQYWLEYQPPTANQKGCITRFLCPYFSNYSSACKHMYYLAGTLMLPVVKAAPTCFGSQNTSGPMANSGKGSSAGKPVDLTQNSTDESSASSQETDSDIKVVQGTKALGCGIMTYRSPQRTKCACSPSAPLSQDPKRTCREPAVDPQGKGKHPKISKKTPAGPTSFSPTSDLPPIKENANQNPQPAHTT
ncbi:hypothetical protein PCANC_24747 [Puccinia coronata f. sp. avenae]|uniref:SWIM-type domain-containing protein n=1 Tax=Puccinia coronata f. sp. avenae TaxID=200324 RepID=A0A2N5TWY4_9BASI|nr:hypothetical protein PCANC_24747 [Puccinia coronata f. sp. avenae]